jgi:hypothetical protein
LSTATAPITMRAENERQAFLKDDGTHMALQLLSCSYWRFWGLRAESADAVLNGQWAGVVVIASDSSHLTFQRMLVARPNRYCNCHLLTLVNTHDSLVEESEFYEYHRHALITAGGGSRVVFRRNYANSRLYPNIPGGYSETSPPGGDNAFIVYPGSDNVIENNISENAGLAGFDVEAAGTSRNNRFLGNINLGGAAGIFLGVRGNTANEMPTDTLIENFVTLGTSEYGGRFLSNRNTRCRNCTFFGGPRYGVATNDLDGWWPEAPSPTVYFTNTLVLGGGSYGFSIRNQADWGIDFSNAHGSSINYAPALGDPHITSSRSIDSQLGTCKVWIPESSPMKRAGRDGADIGANVLYRYVDGVLTSAPLWDTRTGEFPHGAVVRGVNDVPGQSAFDVHQRLNVNTNGCSFPSGYGAEVP